MKLLYRGSNFWKLATCFVVATAMLIAGLPVVEASEVFDGSEAKVLTRPPVKNKHWDKTTKVWLARSCVGESGFWADDECIAIAWIYAKRAHLAGWPLLKMIRRYSAAVKKTEMHRRRWIFELTADAEKPEHWPKTIRWKRHKVAWLNILHKLDRWKRGELPDPIPAADHYGSYRDANQSYRVRTWKRLTTPEGFQNLYFDSSTRHNKAVDKYTKFMVNGRR